MVDASRLQVLVLDDNADAAQALAISAMCPITDKGTCCLLIAQ